jgi:hypothetical protein
MTSASNKSCRDIIDKNLSNVKVLWIELDIKSLSKPFILSI